MVITQYDPSDTKIPQASMCVCLPVVQILYATIYSAAGYCMQSHKVSHIFPVSYGGCMYSGKYMAGRVRLGTRSRSV